MLMALVAGAWAGPAYDALKLRDGADCAALGTGPEVRDELIALAEGDVGPSYVPVRAADCLVSRWPTDEAVVERAKAWVAESKWAGLAIVVAREIDRFTVGDGVAIARAAAAGEDERLKGRLVRRIAESAREEVREAVDGVDGGSGGR